MRTRRRPALTRSARHTLSVGDHRPANSIRTHQRELGRSRAAMRNIIWGDPPDGNRGLLRRGAIGLWADRGKRNLASEFSARQSSAAFARRQMVALPVGQATPCAAVPCPRVPRGSPSRLVKGRQAWNNKGARGACASRGPPWGVRVWHHSGIHGNCGNENMPVAGMRRGLPSDRSSLAHADAPPATDHRDCRVKR